MDGSPVGVSSSDWLDTTATQDNHWTVQVVSMCDITPGEDSAGEIVDGDVHVYRFTGDSIAESGFDTQCLGGKDTITAIVSNQPTGDLSVFDAPYEFRLVGTGKAKGKR